MVKNTKDADEELAEAAPEGVTATVSAGVRKKDFVDSAAGRSGVRKSDAKSVVEATLAELGERLARGEELNLPPLGKVKLVKTRENARAQVMTLRLVQARGKSAETPLAEAAD